MRVFKKDVFMTKGRAAAVFLIAMIGVFYFLTIREGHNWGDDFSQYIHHALNLVQGKNYEDSGYIFNSKNPSAPSSYPPVFPLLLAPLIKCFGLNFWAMKAELIVFFLLVLLLVRETFREFGSEKRLLVLILLLGFSPYFWNFKDQILSDIPFWFFTCGSLFFFGKSAAWEEKDKFPWPVIVTLSFFMVLAYGARYIGIALVPCLVLHDVIRQKKPRVRKTTATAVSLFVLWAILLYLLIPAISHYEDTFKFDPKNIIRNLVILLNSPSELWPDFLPSVLRSILSLGLVAITAVGCVARLRRRSRISLWEIFFACYVPAVIVWPYSQGFRFLIPLMPLAIMYALEGFERILRQLDPFWKKNAKRTLAVLVAAAYIFQYASTDLRVIRKGIAKKETQELFEFVKNQTNPSAVFIFQKPRALALFTGRRAAVYHQGADADLTGFFRRIGATHIVSGRPFEMDGRTLDPFIERNAAFLLKVFENPDFRIFQIVNPENRK